MRILMEGISDAEHNQPKPSLTQPLDPHGLIPRVNPCYALRPIRSRMNSVRLNVRIRRTPVGRSLDDCSSAANTATFALPYSMTAYLIEKYQTALSGFRRSVMPPSVHVFHGGRDYVKLAKATAAIPLGTFSVISLCEDAMEMAANDICKNLLSRLDEWR